MDLVKKICQMFLVKVFSGKARFVRTALSCDSSYILYYMGGGWRRGYALHSFVNVTRCVW